MIEEEYKQLSKGRMRKLHYKSENKQQAITFQGKSHFKKDDLTRRMDDNGLNEINDSDLDMLLEGLEVLDEEDISDSDWARSSDDCIVNDST